MNSALKIAEKFEKMKAGDENVSLYLNKTILYQTLG